MTTSSKCVTPGMAEKRMSMSDFHHRFEQTQQDVNALGESPDNDTLVMLCALYKRAARGDPSGEQPWTWTFDLAQRTRQDDRQARPVHSLQPLKTRNSSWRLLTLQFGGWSSITWRNLPRVDPENCDLAIQTTVASTNCIATLKQAILSG
jgi:acyl-CoA-binding protein